MLQTLLAVVAGMRPKQWVKNVFVLAPTVFALRLDDPATLIRSAVAFAVFCALSSVVYLWNDIADCEADRKHPVKRHRPIASGALSVPLALVVSLLLLAGAVAAAWWLNRGFLAVGVTYLLINVLYSWALKRVVIIDVMLVASGFLLRAIGGGLGVGVEISQWLVLCTALISLFLGFVKRRQEIVALDGSTEQRPTLAHYSLPFLDQMISIVTASTVLAYCLYAFSPEVAEKLGTAWMGLTIPFVLFGIFRYLYLVHQQGEGENPAALVFKDMPLMVNVLAWGGTAVLVLYVL